MAIIANMLFCILRQVAKKTERVLPKLRPRIGPAIRPARNAAVPEFARNVRSKIAGSACGVVKTGGIRKTRLWSPGTATTGVAAFRNFTMEGTPESTTKKDSNRKPVHA